MLKEVIQMEQDEIKAVRYTGAKFPEFKLNSGQELDYQIAIAMLNKDRLKI